MNPVASTNGHSSVTRFYSGSKRVLDVLLSGILMIVLPPLYLIVSVLLRCAGSPQPGSVRVSLAEDSSARGKPSQQK